MFVIYSSRLLNILTLGSRGISGITIFPFIVLRSDVRGAAEALVTINHEKIHIRQQAELLLIVFIIWYIISFIGGRLRGLSWHNAYRSILFEREAYDKMRDLDYLKVRKMFAFMGYRT